MKEKLKKYWYVIILVLIIIVLLGYIVISQNKETETFTSEIIKNTFVNKSNEELIENIQIEDGILEDGRLITILKNNNDCDVKMLAIQVVFYDTANNVVGTAEESFRVLKQGREAAINDYSVPEKFDRYEIKLSLEDVSRYENTYDFKGYTDKIETKSNNSGERIVVTAVNKSDVDLEMLNISVVYYYEGKPVGLYQETQYDVKKDETKYFNLFYGTDKNYKDVKFDEYKIFVNSAYNKY